MRARLVIAMVLGSLLAMSAHARVGDTFKQIEQRYGKPQHVYFVRADARKLGYRFHGFMIVVYFSSGISKWESFTRWPEAGRLPPLPRESVNEILALTAPDGAKWQSIPRTKNGEYWVTHDKKTLAFFATGRDVLLVRDPNFKAKD
jgi:hypothetical protein